MLLMFLFMAFPNQCSTAELIDLGINTRKRMQVSFWKVPA